MSRTFLGRHFSGWALVGGLSIGVAAACLTHFGAPPHGGISASCFVRDTAARCYPRALPIDTDIRMTLFGIILGAFLAAVGKREFRAQGGTPPWLSLAFGGLTALGTGVFVGCPTKLHIRLAGGDPVAIAGLLGLIAGLWLASRLLRRGYDPGVVGPRRTWQGSIFPGGVIAATLAAALYPSACLGDRTWLTARPGYPAPVVALGIGLAAGIIAQHTRVCFTTGWIDLIFTRRAALLWAPVGGVLGAAAATVLLGNHLTFPFGNTYWAHRELLWATLGMVLVGLVAGLAGGCPLRQIIRASQGDRDAALLIGGMAIGSTLWHDAGVVVGEDLVVSSGAKIGVVIGISLVIALARSRFSLDS